ncbi:MAG: flagellar basal body P-ring protein FlgI [Dechloromonas sp.]|uniref:flagellar basal body P-ring protein FlgI n=1 Tax=Azonexaceae TaxID=2008795 RepID=UPI001CF8B3B1|nr:MULTISPECIES: flagellar basal body P-ring protein FlgI [Azonexaceae]MBT9520824.1 flagellar basal body P-ring protein FlgI [Dechloromonas sp.]UCV23764.1 flagellar basal body P-ring protein FlgI [Ferribacterium limneticum]
MKTFGGNWYRQAAIVAACLLPLCGQPAFAERIKDLASIQGVRNNQLIGYGIVVGLDNTGDQTTQTPFTTQAMGNMLSQLGVNLTTEQATKLQLKNVAAVMVTAVMPPFSKPGQSIDITVSSMGNAKSLRGGTLLMTQLKGGDGQVYAVAQGNVLVGGIGASSGGSKIAVNHLSAGRVPSGATIERDVPTAVGQGGYIYYELANTDFGTVQNMVEAINRAISPGTARAIDGRRIAVRAPDDIDARVAFLGRLESLDVKPAVGSALVVINPRTGSVVMNQKVTLDPCAVAHGSLSVVVDAGNRATGQPADIQVTQANGSLMNVKAGANLADVVRALNALGANPLDLLAILQAMKAAGALRAELEVI